mmetsp:Transcript_11219/g.25180  ORF Transcript_11219/g.25180 Transcript_11219/m.25180 type:complete len:221 (-) Transcript_11219:603-1265(-)
MKSSPPGVGSPSLSTSSSLLRSSESLSSSSVPVALRSTEPFESEDLRRRLFLAPASFSPPAPPALPPPSLSEELRSLRAESLRFGRALRVSWDCPGAVRRSKSCWQRPRASPSSPSKMTRPVVLTRPTSGSSPSMNSSAPWMSRQLSAVLFMTSCTFPMLGRRARASLACQTSRTRCSATSTSSEEILRPSSCATPSRTCPRYHVMRRFARTKLLEILRM